MAARVDEGDFLLTQTALGTPMGELLRRYWQPLALTTDLTPDHTIHLVQVLSEKLVLYKNASGQVGLMQAGCTHHGYLMTYGWVEEASIACGFHGWQFDAEGNCFIGYAGRVYPIPEGKARAYPVRRCAGLYWAYLGPPPAPAFPTHEILTRTDGVRRLTVYPIDEHPLIVAAPPRPGSLRLRRPVDDTHTWEVAVELVPGADGAVMDPATEEPEVELVAVGSGIADGARAACYAPWEHLTGDGTATEMALRLLLREQLERVRDGGDPLGVVRDPASD